MKHWIVGSLAMAAMSLSGCASMRTPMAEFATDYNRVIADTSNEMILLNIVRAQLGEPTHYSALSSVSGNLSIEGNAGASLNGIIDDIDANAGIGLTVSSSPSFQIVPLNTSDFATGILRPVEPNVVALFLSQGWNENLLAALLVESVSCNGITHYNDLRPEGERNADRLYLDADQVFGLGFETSEGGNTNEPIISLGADQAESLGMILDNLTDDYRVTVRRDDEGKAIFDVFQRSQQTLNITVSGSNRLTGCSVSALSPDNYELRSVEGVIYYLGEILRSGAGELRAPNGDVVFRVPNSAPAGGHAIHVAHEGRNYYIERANPGQRPRNRSSQVVSLITQLIALQTASDALERSPSTLTIN